MFVNILRLIFYYKKNCDITIMAPKLRMLSKGLTDLSKATNMEHPKCLNFLPTNSIF